MDKLVTHRTSNRLVAGSSPGFDRIFFLHLFLSSIEFFWEKKNYDLIQDTCII